MSSAKPFLPWMVWGVAVALYAIAIVNRSSLSALGPVAQEHFGIDASTLAAFPVIQLLVYAVCQIPVGVLLDRHGATVLILSGSALMFVGQIVMATVTNVELAILARVLVGAGDACTFTAVMRMLPEWFKPRQLSTLGQVTGLIGQLGQLVSVVPLAFVVDRFGWQTGFLGISAAGLLSFLLAAVVLRDAPGKRTALERLTRRTGRITAASESLSAAATTTVTMAPPQTSLIPVVGGARARRNGRSGRESFVMRVRRLLSIPGVRLAYWVHFVTPFSAHAFLLLWGTPFLTGGLGMTPAAASGMLSLTVISSMIAGLILGPISSRFIERRVLLVIWVTVLIMVTWLSVILWPGMPPGWLIIALVVILPLGGPVSMIAFEVARSHTPRSFAGFGTGLVNTGGFTSALLLVMLIGVALDLQGAGSPETYTLHAFKIAFAVQVPLWVIGLTMIMIERRRTGRWMERHGRTLR
ncbi:nitrate/nitrite transporter [Leucobacter albus]|uniref:Lysosomal dipeptide transporter MFSD1 n=1 Tax=Leucobacter albus TaxID=272210 RepID=A0ABW3TPI4_9MICO